MRGPAGRGGRPGRRGAVPPRPPAQVLERRRHPGITGLGAAQGQGRAADGQESTLMATLATVRIVAALEARVEQIIKALTLNVVANLVRPPAQGGTPVDTGWARANWVPSIGAPREALAGSRDSVSAVEQEAGVALVAGTYKLAQGAIFISNN